MEAQLPSRQFGPEHLFAGLLAVFGVIFTFGIPPAQVPDETSHWLRSYHISEGCLFPEMRNGQGGGDLPHSLLDFISIFGQLPFHHERQIDFSHFERAWALPLDPENRHRVDYHTGYYPFVSYGPPAVGLALGRLAGFNVLGIFLMGRLVNLALSVVLVFWAIRITPVFKIVFGMVALLPISVQQFASLSYDAMAIALTLLFAALLFRLVLVERDRISTREITGLLGIALWLTLCKYPYGALALLYLAVPVRRLGSRARYLATGALLFGVVLGATLLYTQFKKFAPDHMTAKHVGASIEKQARFIKSQPGRYAEVLLATAAEHGRIWLDHVGTLGWLDTPVNPLAMELVFFVLVLAALSTSEVTLPVPGRLKLLCVAAAVGCAVIILTSCYLCGSTVKARLIVGPQGRYFVPLVPLLLLAVTSRWVRVTAPAEMILALGAGTSVAVLLVACVSFTRRYYLPAEMQYKTAPLALGAGFTVLATILWFTRRRLLRGDSLPSLTLRARQS